MYLKKNGVAPIELTKYSISSVDCSGIRRISEDNINEKKKLISEKLKNVAIMHQIYAKEMIYITYLGFLVSFFHVCILVP